MNAGAILLSCPQVNALLADRLDGSGPFQVNESRSLAELKASSVMMAARLMMAEMAKGGIKLTARGNLPRKLVEALMDGVSWPGDEVEDTRYFNKVFNEWDFRPAPYLHVLLKVARLARLERNVLTLTRKGRERLGDGSAGLLNAELFRTTFARYNLGYLDRAGRDNFSPQISLILFMVGQVATEWMTADELMPSVTIPPDSVPEAYPMRAEMIFQLRILRYLCWFGLLESRIPAPPERRFKRESFRKAPLYDRVLNFYLP